MFENIKSHSGFCSRWSTEKQRQQKKPPTQRAGWAWLYLQHLFIFSCEEWDRAEDQLEQLEIQVGELDVGAHLRQAVQEVLHQDRSKQSRGSRVCQKGIGDNLSERETHVTEITPSTKRLQEKAINVSKSQNQICIRHSQTWIIHQKKKKKPSKSIYWVLLEQFTLRTQICRFILTVKYQEPTSNTHLTSTMKGTGPKYPELLKTFFFLTMA